MIDPGTLGLIVVAIASIIFGAYQSRALYFHNSEEPNGTRTSSGPPLLG